MKPVKRSDAQLLLTAKLGRPSGNLSSASDSSTSAPITSRPLRVLVAEDDRVNQTLILNLLQAHGHVVRVVDNGRKAVEVSAVEPFDVIVMDLQMPKMDGLEATTEIRRREMGQTYRTPIVALTAHALGGERDQCLGAGMDGYLTKPLRVGEMIRTLGRLANEARKADSESDQAEPPPAANWETSLAATRGNQQLLGEVIEVFLAETPKLLTELRESIDRAQYDKFHRAAHTIKGSLQHFGAARAVAVAKNLEKMGHERRNDGADGQLEQLEHELGAVCDTLNTFKTRCAQAAEVELNVDCPDR